MKNNLFRITIATMAIISFAISISFQSSHSYGNSNIMYMEKLASKEFFKSYSPKKALTKLQAAELLVHIYAKSNKTSVDIIPSYDRLTDTDDIYACKSSNVYLLPPEEGNFKPKSTITRQEFINALRKATKGNNSKLDSKFKKYLAKKLKPKKAISQGDAVKIIYETGMSIGNRVNNSPYSKKNGYNFSKIAKYKTAGYKTVKSIDVDYLKSYDNSLVIFFSGAIVSRVGLSIDDIHYQIAETAASGKNFKSYDVLLLLEHINKGFNSTNYTYNFAEDVFIKGGKIFKTKPSKPYMEVKKGSFLNITLSKGKVK